MSQKRHKKGSSDGGRFAPDLSGKQPPSSEVQSLVLAEHQRTCQKCRKDFVSADYRWAQVCSDCQESAVSSVYSEYLKNVTPLSMPGAPERLDTFEGPGPSLDEEDADTSQDLAQYKGLGKFDYTLREGDHFEVTKDVETGVEFRRLTDEGRKEFGKLITRLGPPHDWPAPLKEFIEENNISSSAPGIRTSWDFHLNSILAAHPEYAFDRDDLVEFRRAYSGWYLRRKNEVPRPSQSSLTRKGDSIQPVNKSGQWGLQHQTVYYKSRNHPYYTLRPPFTFLPNARKLRKTTLPDNATKEALVKRQQARIAQRVAPWFDTPWQEWDYGHASPDDPTPTVLQPRSYQRSLRDRFKFDDDGFVLVPTVKEIVNNSGKYYSTEEQMAIALNFLDNLQKAGHEGIEEDLKELLGKFFN